VMNLKLRFALLFTLFVAIILLVSSITIYVLFSAYRKEDYYRRVAREGVEVHNLFISLAQEDGKIANKLIKGIHDKALYYERLFILDSSGAVVFRFSDTLHTPFLPVSLEKIREIKTYKYNSSNKDEGVALYITETHSYIIVSGYDRNGYSKLANLKLILISIFFGSVLLAAFVSSVFVRQAVKPLKNLGLQMKKTTVQNLIERIEVPKAKDEINEIARNFNAMLERLKQAFDFQKSFVHHASHELRTPLATMLSQTESALSRDMSQEEYKKLLHSLHDEQVEMIDLTNSLLLISQYDEMNNAHDLPYIRIDEVLYETMSQAKRMFPGLIANIRFNIMPDNDDHDFTIRGNETLLKSAFSNLLKNAYMYSVDQKVNIILEPGGETIMVHFDNKGTQLPADEKENIMAPFFRGGNALKTKGHGLGLSIVYRSVSIHKGTVTYTPISNDINRFTITLNKAS
jgi:signal transduction histidine kinase